MNSQTILPVNDNPQIDITKNIHWEKLEIKSSAAEAVLVCNLYQYAINPLDEAKFVKILAKYPKYIVMRCLKRLGFSLLRQSDVYAFKELFERSARTTYNLIEVALYHNNMSFVRLMSQYLNNNSNFTIAGHGVLRQKNRKYLSYDEIKNLSAILKALSDDDMPTFTTLWLRASYMVQEVARENTRINLSILTDVPLAPETQLYMALKYDQSISENDYNKLRQVAAQSGNPALKSVVENGFPNVFDGYDFLTRIKNSDCISWHALDIEKDSVDANLIFNLYHNAISNPSSDGKNKLLKAIEKYPQEILLKCLENSVFSLSRKFDLNRYNLIIVALYYGNIESAEKLYQYASEKVQPGKPKMISNESIKDISSLLVRFIKKGHLKSIQWLWERSNNNFLLRMFETDGGLSSAKDVFEAALVNGCEKTVAWFLDKIPDAKRTAFLRQISTTSLLEEIIQIGHFYQIKWLLAQLDVKDKKSLIKAESGRLFNAAVLSDQFEMAEYLLEQLDNASECEEMLEQLFYLEQFASHKKKGSTKLEWLLRQSPQVLRDKFSNNIFKKNEGAKTFNDQFDEMHCDLAMARIKCKFSPPATVKRIQEVYENFFPLLALQGHLSAMQWMRQELTNTTTTSSVAIIEKNKEAFSCAALNGHMDVIAWLWGQASDEERVELAFKLFVPFHLQGKDFKETVLWCIQRLTPANRTIFLERDDYHVFWLPVLLNQLSLAEELWKQIDEAKWPNVLDVIARDRTVWGDIKNNQKKLAWLLEKIPVSLHSVVNGFVQYVVLPHSTMFSYSGRSNSSTIKPEINRSYSCTGLSISFSF